MCILRIVAKMQSVQVAHSAGVVALDQKPFARESMVGKTMMIIAAAVKQIDSSKKKSMVT